MLVCWPLAAPIGLSPLHILTLPTRLGGGGGAAHNSVLLVKKIFLSLSFFYSVSKLTKIFFSMSLETALKNVLFKKKRFISQF